MFLLVTMPISSKREMKKRSIKGKKENGTTTEDASKSVERCVLAIGTIHKSGIEYAMTKAPF